MHERTWTLGLVLRWTPHWAVPVPGASLISSSSTFFAAHPPILLLSVVTLSRWRSSSWEVSRHWADRAQAQQVGLTPTTASETKSRSPLLPTACPLPSFPFTNRQLLTMRQSPSLLLFAFGSPAAAWLKNPFSSSQSDESWTPPRETSPAEHDAQFAQGWTPRPTDAPKPRFGRMNLLPRDDDYVLAPGTCGFISSNECKWFINQELVSLAQCA
jgi:hypothetical protein